MHSSHREHVVTSPYLSQAALEAMKEVPRHAAVAVPHQLALEAVPPHQLFLEAVPHQLALEALPHQLAHLAVSRRRS